MKKLSILIILLLLISAVSVEAGSPKGGLGDVAVSPDGKTLVVGGDNRVLYVMEEATMTVQKRIWLKTNIYEMEFNKDGSVLVVEDTSGILYFINTQNWEVLNQVRNAGSMSAAPAIDLVAGFRPSYKKSIIKFFSMTDGSQKGQIEFPGKVISIGLNAKGTKLVVLAKGPTGKEEKKRTPKDLKGMDKAIFKQKNDGRVSIFAEFELPSGKKIQEKIIFYTDSRPSMIVREEATYLIAYSNVNAKITNDQITLFKAKSSYNYGVGISPDRTSYLVGGLRDGTTVSITNDTMITYKVGRLPGWPEYFKGFGFAKDGTGYGVTTSYRVVKISKTGQVESAVPVY